jgi:hypothetical protein
MIIAKMVFLPLDPYTSRIDIYEREAEVRFVCVFGKIPRLSCLFSCRFKS